MSTLWILNYKNYKNQKSQNYKTLMSQAIRFKSKSGFTSVRTVRARRPIDKLIINVAKSVGTTQLSTTLLTATFPCTVTGLRWQFVVAAPTTGTARLRWVIVRVKQSVVASTMASSDASSLYDPEQEVIAWGVTQVADLDAGTGPAIQIMMGDTKSMRKLMGGDTIQVLCVSTAAATAFNGIVQFFCKS